MPSSLFPNFFGRFFTGTCLAAAVLFAATVVAAPASTAGKGDGDGYRYYEIGDIAAKRPQDVWPGLLLVGGGDWPYDGFRWFIERAGHGRIVILRASGDVEAQNEFFNDIGGITAAQTLVFSSRTAASDARVLDLVRNADGVFLAGGDQANYVRYWKGTPLAAALGDHVRAGKPIAGTSAGLAVLGEHVYGALDGGSQTSPDALADPTGPQSTLVDDFLHLPFLAHVITDSHFDQRARQGRLISWIARLVHQGGRKDITGIGIDEYTALAIGGDGQARVFSGNGGHVWLFRPLRAADVYAPGKPLSFHDVPAIGLGTDSVLHLPQFRVERPAFEVVYDVEAGKITKRPKP
jgi:cyanophycinase